MLRTAPEGAQDIPDSLEYDSRCPRCGLSRGELYKQGRMGCVQCYETFGEEVTRALKEIHGEVQHIGKS